MHPRIEKALTFAALLAAAGASVATSAAEWTLGNETSGDVMVDDQEQTVRVQVRSSIGAQIRVEAQATAGTPLDPPVLLEVSPPVAYASSPDDDAGSADTLPKLPLTSGASVGMDLPGASCARNCVADVELHFPPAAAGQRAVQVHWVVKAGIGGGGDGTGDVPPDAYVDVVQQR